MNWRPIIRWLRVKHSPMPVFVLIFFSVSLFYKERDLALCGMFALLSLMSVVLYKCPCPKD